MSVLYVILGIAVLYLTHRKISFEVSRLIHRLGGNQNILIWAWSLFFLPGTIIHELSHFLIAAATGARTGKIEIFPEFIEDLLDEEKSHHVTLGSVQVARLNPLQGFLVGFAPFISGLILLVWLAPQAQANYLSGHYWTLALQIYLFFVIANSFFPSWSDVQQTLPLLVFITIVFLLTWFFGFQFFLGASSPIWFISDTINHALMICLLFNFLIIGILSLLNRLLRR